MITRYTQGQPFSRFTYANPGGKLTRVDFDRPVIVYEIRVGVTIVALDAMDPIHTHGVKVGMISHEERSRFTFNLPYPVTIGMRIMVNTDRECKILLCIVNAENDETIEAEYKG